MIRDWKNFNEVDFREELQRELVSFSINCRNLNGNAKFNRFLKLFNKLVNKHLPLRQCTRKERKRRTNPWMSNAIYKSIKTKNKLYFIQRKYPFVRNKIKYKRHRNELNRIILIAKREYYKSKLQFCANKSKAIWSVINEILSKKKKITKINKIANANDELVEQPIKIATAFNTYFGNVGKHLASNITPLPHKIFSNRAPQSFVLFDTSADEISKLIASLNPKKGNRINDAPTAIVKLSNYIIAPFLCDIFNSCI